ncbi:MAG: hypothetical protein BroJett013_12230 [Alphaproteobacteria bacterium]|nr:MAG: hypothetical protein BroJett013_12230 [Alphaproteobacteria bacterium]
MKRYLAALFLGVLAATGCSQPASSGLPDSIASAGVTQSDWLAIRAEVSAQAQRAGITEASLLAAVEAAGTNFVQSGQINPQYLTQVIIEQIDDQADAIVTLNAELDTLTTGQGEEAASSFRRAREAIDAGRLNEADQLLAEAAERDLAILQEATSETDRRRLRAGETIANRARLASAQIDFLAAAEHYSRAAQVVPQSAIAQRAEYGGDCAGALYMQAITFNDEVSASRAVETIEQSVLPLVSRSQTPEAWASAQKDLGTYFHYLGTRDVPGALERSVAANMAALSVYDRDQHQERWVFTQIGLGNAYLALGNRGMPGAFERAAAAFTSALSVATPAGRADEMDAVRFSLGALYVSRSDPAELRQAVTLFEDILTRRTRESDPDFFGSAHANLGRALYVLGDGQSLELLDRSVTSFEQSISVRSREQSPAAWARAQNGLGNSHAARARLGAPNAYQQAVQAYESALAVSQELGDAPEAARTAYNLAIAYAEMGDIPRARSTASTARQLFESAGDTNGAIEVMAFLGSLPPT